MAKISHNDEMPDNFTPLPSSLSPTGPLRVGKGAVDVNAVLIIVAILITLILAGLMWFLIYQKQLEESKADSLTNSQTQVIRDVVPGDNEQPSTVATPPAMISPTSTPSATLTPQASPSAIITQ